MPAPHCLQVELQPDGTLTGNDTNVLAGGWRNIVSLPIWRASGIPIQHTWNDTVILHGGHTKPWDCTHFCRQGGRVWLACQRVGVSGHVQQRLRDAPNFLGHTKRHRPHLPG